MSSPKPPPAPDYTGAAQATGASALENTRAQASLNRPDINTPLGSQSWKMIGPDQYEQNITLSPEGQIQFENESKMNELMGKLGIKQLEGSSEMLAQPFDINAVGGGQQEIQDALYRRSTSMLDPQYEHAEDKERDRLANQGFQTGTEGYDNAIGNFDRAKAFAYGDARDRAIVGGQDARKQAVQEALLARQTPLNEINALKTGSQVQMPQFQATAPSGQSAPTDYLGATTAAGQFSQGLYGNQVAETNAQRQAVASMGTMAALYAMMPAAAPAAALASDRRLKRDIVKISNDPRGFGIYKFKYLWSNIEYIGVMADELEKVMPEAVTEIGGYKAVYYGML